MTMTAAVPQDPSDEAQKRAIAVWTDLLWLMPPERTVTVTRGRVAVELGPRRRPRSADPAGFAAELKENAPSRDPWGGAFPFPPIEEFAMPDPRTAEPFGPVIFAYTRRQAIEDGVLVDVSETAREAGFRIPVALSRSVWERLVALPEGYRGFQDEAGRLWDVLWMARHYALQAADSDRVRMCVLVRDSNRPPRKHFPIVAIGAGDRGEPVVTVMFSEDD